MLWRPETKCKTKILIKHHKNLSNGEEVRAPASVIDTGCEITSRKSLKRKNTAREGCGCDLTQGWETPRTSLEVPPKHTVSEAMK